jgi:hypothetical protein
MLRTVLWLVVIAPWGPAAARDLEVAAQGPEVSEAAAQGAAYKTPPQALEAKAPTGDALRPDSSVDGAAAAQNGPAAEAAKSNAPRARIPRHPSQRLTPEQALDERVLRLTRALELDEAQQARLREVLTNERRQIMKLRTDNPHPQADRVGPALAILDHTREEIRAMLNEEQKKKYPAPVPRSATTAASADVDYWMRLMQPAPPQGAQAGH